ncbi:MAG: hypothetical protein GY811_15835, partial [Myxococcales bacterium]|nr:hypothetical protein [Myxococcales bacterium]
MKNRLGALLIIGTGAGLLTLADGTQEATTVVAQSAVEDGCPETSVPESQTGTTLEGFAIDTNGGVVYTSSGGGSLGLEMQGGLFKQTMMPVTEQFNAVDVADFDEDGWVDIIASHTNENYVRFFKNETGGGPNYNSIDWTDPDDVAPPIFTGAKKSDGTILYVDGDGAGNLSDTHQNYDPEKNVGPPSLIAGDYNNDGHADFVYIRNHSLSRGKPTKSAEMFLGKGDGTFEPKYDLLANSIPPSALGNNSKGATGKAI